MDIIRTKSTNTVTLTRDRTAEIDRQRPATIQADADRQVQTVERDSRKVEATSPGLQGPRGLPGDASITLVAGATLGAHRLVRTNSIGQPVYVDAANELHGDDTAGITLAAAAEGAEVSVQRGGRIEFNGWNFTPESPVFAGMSGGFTQVPPTDSAGYAFSQIVGHAATHTALIVSIQPPIYF